MAKGSVRKRGKKWYYRFYIKDANGQTIQREFAGSESKQETERMLREALETYEKKNYIVKADKTTLGELLDLWLEEELHANALSNGTVSLYTVIIRQLKTHPICSQSLRSITTGQLQKLMDLIVLGGTYPDGSIHRGYSNTYAHSFSAVLQRAFRYAIFPGQIINYNPMQYVTIKKKTADVDLFLSKDASETAHKCISHEQYLTLMTYLTQCNPNVILPIQISYYSGLRLGEVCGLSWQDIHLDEQFLVVRRSVKYNRNRQILEIGCTKRNKVRTVDFCNTLAQLLREAWLQQQRRSAVLGKEYKHTYYRELKDQNRNYFEYRCQDGYSPVPEDYHELPLVCRRPDGGLVTPNAISIACRTLAKKLPDFEHFHFHMLRHSYTSNLLAGGAAPKDVQELLGHSSVSTTMNIYAHSTRDAKRSSSHLLDQLNENENQ